MSLRDGPFPNKGWLFYMPQFRWHMPNPLGVTFNGAVTEIIKVRTKGSNMAITRKHKLSTDFYTVADELEAFTRQRLGLAEAAPPKHLPQRLEEPQAVAGGVEGFLANTGRRLKAAATGIKVYVDTFGETGRPVEAGEAERRAAICATCPKNEKGDWKSFFTEEAASGIMGVLGILRDIDLHTSHDANLGVCSACFCPLKAKVHVKKAHILAHTNQETIAALKEAPACWIVEGL